MASRVPSSSTPRGPARPSSRSSSTILLIVTSENAGKTVSRRTVAKGIAWGVPAITMLGATPAFAGSKTPFAFTSLAPAVINVANPTASLTAEGTGPDGATITLVIGESTVGTATVVDGEWSATIPAGNVTEGLNVEVTALSSKGEDATQTYTKDITAPAPSINQAPVYSSPNKTFTVTGTMGNASTPTADNSTGTLTIVIGGSPTNPASSSVTVTRTGTTWSYTFSGVQHQPGSGNAPKWTLQLTQGDGAGNIGSSGDTSVPA